MRPGLLFVTSEISLCRRTQVRESDGFRWGQLRQLCDCAPKILDVVVGLTVIQRQALVARQLLSKVSADTGVSEGDEASGNQRRAGYGISCCLSSDSFW